ncbi:MAG: rhomboid family intramembrane serine protease [Pseudomonadota bacterium]
MPAIRLLQRPIDQDLAPFSLGLVQAGIAHRIFEESGSQVVELADARQVDAAQALFEAFSRGELELQRPPARAPATRSTPMPWRVAPVVISVLALALLVYLLTAGGDFRLELTRALAIADPVRADDHLIAALARGELWRPLTPALLHFGVLHLAFNGAIVWELGRRIEARQGSGPTVLLILLLAAGSNLAQYLLGDGPRFGGLSGVAYGLLGYVLLAARRQPRHEVWRLQPGLAISLLLFLVVFSTGITELFSLYVANAAHWGGLVAGWLLAVLMVRPEQVGAHG